MGQLEIYEAILEYFSCKGYATPKELCNQLYPIFQKRYPDKDTFRRLITRNLRRLPLVKHPLRPFYCNKKSEAFDFILHAGWFNLLYQEGVEIVDMKTGWSGNFQDHFLKKHGSDSE